MAVRACGICGSDVHGFDGTSGRRTPPLIMGARRPESSSTSATRCAVGSPATGSPSSRRSLWRVPRLPRGPREPLCPPGGARRVVPRLPPRRGLRGARCGTEQGARSAPGRAHVRACRLRRAARRCSPRRRARRQREGCNCGRGRYRRDRPPGRPGTPPRRSRHRYRDRPRRAAAPARSRLGADVTVRAGDERLGRTVADATGGRGTDVVVEAVGNAAAISTAVGCAGRGGRIVLVGNVTPVVELPLQAVVTGELTLVGSCASSGELGRGLELLASGAVDVDPLISAVAPLAEGRPGSTASTRRPMDC